MTAIQHAGILTGRELARWRRQPWQPVANLAFSIMLLLVFGLLLGGAIEVPGGDDYVGFLVPGMLTIVMMFGIQATMLGMAEDAKRGITDRFRSLPMRASAVAFGRCGADMVTAATELAVLVAGGLLLGWRIDAAWWQVALAVLLLLWLRFGIVWLGILLALTFRTEGATNAAMVLVWPIGFASNVFVAPETMPGWLRAISEWNPLSATATATRALLGNPTGVTVAWYEQASMWLAIGWPAVMVAVCLPLAARAYRRLGD